MVVTLAEPVAVPSPCPPHGCNRKPRARCCGSPTRNSMPSARPAELRRLFPDVRDIAANGMPLRAIFVALAKASRAAA